MEENNILLSTACCSPVLYYSLIAGRTSFFLEQHENYIKQTYRNRYIILGPNGIEPLIIPVEHGRQPKFSIRDVRIAYHTAWQRNHWRTIFTAYNNSPFFQFYCDDIRKFYEKKWTYLFDFNLEYMETLLPLCGLKSEIILTGGFEMVPEPFMNFRTLVSPKSDYRVLFPRFQPAPYTQVFSEKSGFIANLSILDLLFNSGPQTPDILHLSGAGVS